MATDEGFEEDHKAGSPPGCLGGPLSVAPAALPPTHPRGASHGVPFRAPHRHNRDMGLLCHQSAALGTWVFSTTLLNVPEPSSWEGPELTNPSVSLCVKKQESNRIVVCPVHLGCLPSGWHRAGAQAGSWMVLCTGLPERGRRLGAWVRGFTFIYDGEL